MSTIAPTRDRLQAETNLPQPGLKSSANGGVLLLTRAWAALDLSMQLMPGVLWQGQGGLLILFVFVSLPLLSAKSVLAIADM